MDEKRIAQIGSRQVDIGEVVRDPRGIEDIVTEILERDFIESRYAQFGAHQGVLSRKAEPAKGLPWLRQPDDSQP